MDASLSSDHRGQVWRPIADAKDHHGEPSEWADFAPSKSLPVSLNARTNGALDFARNRFVSVLAFVGLEKLDCAMLISLVFLSLRCCYRYLGFPSYLRTFI